MTDRDREICAAIGPLLREKGQIFVGIDVIGDWLTEINVTSPTGLQELERFDGINATAKIWEAIERAPRPLMSWQLLALDVWLRLTEKPRLAREQPIIAARARMERNAARPFRCRAAQRLEVRLLDEPRREPVPPAAPRVAPEMLLWLHGGAYCLGSPRTHAATRRSARATARGPAAMLPDYRLAPEHAFPAAVEDALAAWRGAPRRGLAARAHRAGRRQRRRRARLRAPAPASSRRARPPPAGVLAFSPWTDLTLVGREPRQPRAARRLPAGAADRRDPRPVSCRRRPARPARVAASRPLPRRAAGPDPGERRRDPARRRAGDGRAARRRRRAGHARPRGAVPARLAGRTTGRLPEADAALDRAAAFLRRSPQKRVIAGSRRNRIAATLVKGEEPAPGAAATQESKMNATRFTRRHFSPAARRDWPCRRPDCRLAPPPLFEVTHTDAEWRAMLSPAAYAVLREARHRAALHQPAARRAPQGHLRLRRLRARRSSPRDTKFDSGTGWPSFWQPLDNAVGTDDRHQPSAWCAPRCIAAAAAAISATSSTTGRSRPACATA